MDLRRYAYLWIFRAIFIAAMMVWACFPWPSRAAVRAPSCQVFIDNRADRLVYHVRQLTKIELNAYARTGSGDLDRDGVTFKWSVDPPTAAVADADPYTPGRAFFYPGRRERSYVVTVTASYRPDTVHAVAAISCGFAGLRIDVENDYTNFLTGGGVWTGGSSGLSTRIVHEFDGLSIPMLLSFAAEHITPQFEPTAEVTGTFGIKLADPRIYLEADYYHRTSTTLNTGGIVVGFERLLDEDRSTSLTWSLQTCFCTFHPLFVSLAGTYLLPADRTFIEIGANGEYAASQYAQTTEFVLLGQRL